MSRMTERPVSILIAALGGDGGAVLSNWLVDSAIASDFQVQSTSIPGIAQRTGATTYYIKIYPVRLAELNGAEPVLTLTPGPGDIDLIVASELLEAGRAMQNGFISPDRTTLIASRHRLYTVAEKTVSADGRFKGEQIIQAAEILAEKVILRDFHSLAEESGSNINAMLLGAMAATGKLPFDQQVVEQTIRNSGIAVEVNLKELEVGFREATGNSGSLTSSEPASEAVMETSSTIREARPLLEQVEQHFPEEIQALVKAGVLRTVDFQDVRYGSLYLDRINSILNLEKTKGESSGYTLTQAVARNLALWMAYEDVIRVADLKTRPERLIRIHDEVRARKEDLVEVVDYLKPGIEELCSLLPAFAAKPILRWSENRNLVQRLHLGMHIKTTSISGFMLLKTLGLLRPLRRFTFRFGFEHSLIERWVGLVQSSMGLSHELALEIIECVRLIKGYGETHRRGLENFQFLLNRLVEPGLETANVSELTSMVRSARQNVLSSSDEFWLKDQLQTTTDGRPFELQPKK